MLKELLQKREEYEAEMIVLQDYIKQVNCDIEHILAGRLQDLRALQAKEFGAVNMVFEGFKVTETVPKKVEWDQEKMLGIFDRILSSGDRPANYMKLKFEVSEKQYADFADPIKAIFADARTVKPGRATLKFEEVPSA